MLKIIKQNSNTIYYECGCGSRGMCSFKSVGVGETVVIIKCSSCQEFESLTIFKHNENTKKDDFNRDLFWVPSFNEEIIVAE